MHTQATVRKKVIILGGGFGGVYSAKYLKRYCGRQIDIELISQTNHFVFQPLLPEVAAGIIGAADSVTSLRALLPGVKIRMADVQSVDLAGGWVHFLQGSRRKPQKLQFDHLVLAPGQQTDLTRTRGCEDHSFTLRNVSDAQKLRNHVIRCLEHADVTRDEQLKQRLLSFVVAGGGFSGVETIGELMEMVRRAIRHYPDIQRSDIRFTLIQRGKRLLPELPEKLALYAQRVLTRRGAVVRLGSSLKDVTGTRAALDDGTCIPTSTVVTTVGNRPTVLAEMLSIPLTQGKIPTDEMLRVEGYDSVWALGDAALVRLGSGNRQTFAPPTAQFARQQARHIAANLSASLKGKPLNAFNYTPKGALASLGAYRGVAEIYGMQISGLLAWLMWRSVYIGLLPGMPARLRVALNWLFDYFAPRRIVQIEPPQINACKYVYYHAGDIVFEPGQWVDGFYLIVEGTLESRVFDESLQDDFVRILGPGDHWGERSLIGKTHTRGNLVALEDCRVLLLSKPDFERLVVAFPVIDQYLAGIPGKTYPTALRPATPRLERTTV